jgi:hypothetical protein
MKVALLALFVAVGHASYADDSSGVGPVLESLDGAESAQVTGPDGQIHEVTQGEELEYGDELAPTPAAARIVFEDGTQVLLPAQTGAVVRPGEVEIREGEVRALVEPAGTTGGNPALGQPAPHKFLIRTRTAVLGVRGTDFLVSSKGDETSVHTVDGVVDIARDETSLRSGQGQRVAPGEFSEASSTRAPTPAAKYDVTKYLNDYHQRHPRLARLHEAARQDAQSGHLKRRFQQLRARPRARTLRQQRVQKQAARKLQRKTKAKKRRAKQAGRRKSKQTN